MKKSLLSLMGLLLLAAGARAQSINGEILGAVRDASGATIPNARVTVRNLGTNAGREAVSGPEGRFRVPQLPAGEYEVAVEKQGFSRYVQGPITLRLNQDADLDVRLQVSGVSETVNVNTDAPLLNTTNAEIGVNFDTKRINELPLAPNRNILNLALSVAGVSQLSSGNSSFASGGVSFSVNGMRTRSNNFMIDGQDSNNPSVGGLVQEINNQDVVAEFRLITNQFLPEYGRAAGSVVSIVTKSGTNKFHGSGYWFYNGNKLNARSNLDKRNFPRAPWRIENQFSGTFGGPVIKNKTFFFGSILRWTDRQLLSGPSIGGAPTQAGQELIRSLAGTRPQVQALLSNLPAAQTPIPQTARLTVGGQSVQVPLGTLSGAALNTISAWQTTGRVDHRFNDKHNLYGRYMLDDRSTLSGQAVPPGLTSQNPARRQAISAAMNSSFSPTMFNELRASYQRLASNTFAANKNAESIPSLEISELGLTGFNAATARTAIGLAVNLPQFQFTNNYQLSNTLRMVRGGHSMAFGFDFRRQEQIQDFNPTVRGRLQYVSLQDLVDDVPQVAAINTFLPGVGRVQQYRYYDYFFFLQDEWRVSPKFTLTYGIRYETPGNPADYLAGVNRQVLARNNNNPDYAFTPIPPRDKNNWAPRLGFNYRLGKAPGPLGFLTGDGATVLRGGYSRTYDLVFNNIFLNVFSAFPFTLVTQLPARTQGGFTAIDRIAYRGQAPPQPASLLQVPRTIVANDFRAPFAEQFSFQLQRQLSKDYALTVGWVGTKGTALFQSIDGNPTVPGSLGRQRIDNARGPIRLRANAASSVYHSLQASLEKRLSRNFSMASHYTWSAFIDDA